MINLTAMMGRITGKNVDSAQHPGGTAAGEAGITTVPGGAFAALVQLVARTTPATPQAGGMPGLEPDVAGPDAAIAPADAVATADAPGDAPGAVLPNHGKVTSWTPLADGRATLHKAVAMAVHGPAPDAGAPAAGPAGPTIATTPDRAHEEDDASMALAGDDPSEATGETLVDALAASSLAADNGRMQADGPATQAAQPARTVTTAQADAAIMAAPVAGQQVGVAASQSRPADGTEAAPSSGRPAPIVMEPQVAMAGEARPRGHGKFFTPPVMPGEIVADGKPKGGTDDGAGQRASTSTGLADSRRNEVSAVGPLATSGSGAAGSAMPLRMIVESLPPVVQSALAVGVAATVSGPSTAQQLGDQVIDMGVSGQWIDRMAREITALAEGGGHSRFTLNPPHLGRLQVDLWQGLEATSVRFVAETDEAARRLGEGRAALQADARLVALNLGSVTIEKSALPHESTREGGGQRPGSDTAGQAQQQTAGQGTGGQGQAQGQHQARAGTGQTQDDWIGRSFRDEQDEQGDASPARAARWAADGHVRFA
ncbi:MAG TPA: flagellar hook-length control protein FliK [Sphingobium sp.]|nr:flagellar hook-length control protein FliK [Sphingobium sp.]